MTLKAYAGFSGTGLLDFVCAVKKIVKWFVFIEVRIKRRGCCDNIFL